MFSWMKILFYFLLNFSFVLAFSSESWFFLWVSLETNMMSFIPIMYNNNNISTQSMIKYFMVQTISSSTLLFAFLISDLCCYLNWNSEILLLSLFIKIGLAPMFFWIPSVLEGLSWYSFFFLSSFQKIIPCYIISNFHNNTLLWFIIIFSSCISSIFIISQSSMRKFLAFSSINHLSWTFMLIFNKSYNWIFYLLLYFLLLSILCYTLSFYNMSSLSHINPIFMNFNSFWNFNYTIFSFMGVPPFLGFFMKMITLNMFFCNPFLCFLLIFNSLIMMFSYVRSIFPNFFFVPSMKKYSMFLNKSFFFMFFCNMFSIWMIFPLI